MNHLFRYSVAFAVALFLYVGSFAQQSKEQMASYFFSHGDYAQAVELYEPLYENTSNKFYYQMLLRSYIELEEYRKAESLANKRLKRFPNELAVYVDLGNLYLKKGDAKKAEKTFQTAIEKVGIDSRQVSDLVLAFDADGYLDKAIQTYLSSRQKAKNQFLYVNELASLYARKGDYQSMMSEYFGLLDHSPGSLNAIQLSIQRILSDSDNPQLVNDLRRTLVNRVQAQPNNRQNLDMMIWFSMQQKDFQFALTQAKAVDSRFPDQQGEILMRVANIAQSNAAYAVASAGYAAIVKKGVDNPYYFDARVGELQVAFAQLNPDFNLPEAELSRLEKRYQATLDELGKDNRTIPLMRQFSQLLAYYDNDVQQGSDLLYDILEIPRLSPKIRDEVKLELGDLLLFAGDTWEASLLYMQVEKANKNDILGANAKFKNAKLSFYNHDFQWAKSQLEVLRASTSKLIANDAMELSLVISDNMEEDSTFDMLELFADADLLLYRNQLDSAWNAFDEISHRTLSHPLLDDVLMKQAKIRLKQGNYPQADALLEKLIQFYPNDILADDALFLRGQLNEKELNNLQQASQCYEKLIIDYPSSLYLEQARKSYEQINKSR